MLIHAHMINPGDTIITAIWQDGQKVQDVEVMEDDCVKVTYINGSLEWFTLGQIVVRRGNE